MKLHEKIAQRIESDILSDATQTLPTIRDLVQRYDASTKTICAAVRILQLQGRIVTHRGRRMTRPASISHPSAAATDASGILSSEISEEILSGSMRVGEQLPKLDFFVLSRKIGRNTATEALQRLAERNLIHKVGKRWLVGPHRSTDTGASTPAKSENWPVAIVVVPTESSWHTLFDNPHTGSFMTSLKGELVKHGVQLFLVQRERSASHLSQAPAGIDELRACIRRFGSRYIGGLICDFYPIVDEIGEWAQELSCHGKLPVAFFDQTDTGAACTRSEMRLGTRFFRMHFDETAAVNLAVSHLIGHGHRVIGFPTTTEWNSDWATRRVDIARSVAHAHPSHPEIVTSVLGEPFWRSQFAMPENQRLASWVKQIGEQAALSGTGGAHGRRRSFQQQVLSATPSMASLLDRNITALLSLNDWLAQPIFLWLKAVGIEIPRRLSVVSFDNIPASVILPITTIDFGLDRLGYLAAHVLIDDISVKADRLGCVAGECSVVNRGSVARAKR